MDSKTLRKWMPLSVIVAAVLIIAMMLGGTYNVLNSAKLDVDAKWAQVENVMQRRHDLIPNLTNAVKGSMKQERQVFGAIADARKAYAAAADPNDKLAPDGTTSAVSSGASMGLASIRLIARSRRIVLPFRLCVGLSPVLRQLGRCR